MARSRRSVTRSAWLFGQTRPDLLEQDGSDLRESSAREITNMRIRSSGSLLGREGTRFIREVPDAFAEHEIRPAPGEAFNLLLFPDRLEVLDQQGTLLYTAPDVFTPETWVSATGPDIRIGSQTKWPQKLTYAGGAWSLSATVFDPGPGGTVRQPYFSYRRNVAIRPSAQTGSITVTASEPVFLPGHVGARLRYLYREIIVTGYVSATQVTGTVMQTLPPTFRVTVADASGFLVDQSVTGEDSLVEGVITNVSGSDVDVLVTQGYEGLDSSEVLIGPDHRSTISATAKISPGPSTVWDEQLLSAARGYPGYCASVQGRVIYLDFPNAPSVLAASVPGAGDDFFVDIGADDEAIIEKVGDETSSRLRYCAAADDLLLLSDQAVYYHDMRRGGALTPETFFPIKFASVGTAGVEPETVDEGLVFVAEGGNRILACVLQGDINKSWTVMDLSEFAPEAIGTPVALGVTEGDSEFVERYIFATRSDGRVALGRWQTGPDAIGWVPWETEGTVLSMETILGRPYAIVDREIDGVTRRFLERFEDGYHLDCAASFSVDNATLALETHDGTALTTHDGAALTFSGSAVPHLAGATVSIWADGGYRGDFEVASDGTLPDLPDGLTVRQAGLSYPRRVSFWPPESEIPRRGFAQPRISRVAISVRGTAGYTFNGQRIGPWQVGDDFSAPPPLRTEVQRIPLLGRADHPDLVIEKAEPGPFELLAISMEVAG